MDFTDAGTIAFVVISTFVALAVVAGVIAFAFWYDGE